MTDPLVPFDAGLQPERTLLAWRRTCLAIAVAGVLVIRFMAPQWGSPAVVFGLTGLLCACVAYLAAALRYRRAHRRLVGGEHLPPAGASVSLAAASVALLGVAAVVWLIVGPA